MRFEKGAAIHYILGAFKAMASHVPGNLDSR
jgi:hypothetical protein